MKYAKILTVGDPLLADLFKGKTIVEEKVDGSQFRAWLEGTEWVFGSKGVNWDGEHPVDKMFTLGVEQARQRLETIVPEYPMLFVFEYLKTKRHNTLNYDRVPNRNLVLLDVFINGIPCEDKSKWAQALDFETPPVLATYDNVTPSLDELKALLEKTSFLGGQKVEGIVIKNYNDRIVVNGRSQPIFAKYVREEFKEMNRENWGEGISLEERIMSQFQNKPRWEKALVHLRDEGKLTDSPRDIGNLMIEVQKDFEEECKHIVMEDLWKHYRHIFAKMSRAGLPEWYKERLLAKQVGGELNGDSEGVQDH